MEDEKVTTHFEPSNPEVIINKAYLDANLSKIEAQTSFEKKRIKRI